MTPQASTTPDTLGVPGFAPYRRSQIAELRPYVDGEKLSDRVSVSAADREAGSPKPGDMIARNPVNHDDQWLVAADYFAANFEAARPAATTGGEREAICRIVEHAVVRHGVDESDLEGTMDDADAILAALYRPAPVAGERDPRVQCPDCGQRCASGSVHNCPYRGPVTVPQATKPTDIAGQPAAARGGDIDGLEDYLRNQALTAVTDEGASILLEWAEALSAKGGS